MTTIAPALQDRATPIDELHPHPKNARTRSAAAREQLRSSLQTHGQYRTVIARRIGKGKSSRLELLAGHGTVEEARNLGWTHVAVDVHEGISDDQAAKIVLVDNRTNREHPTMKPVALLIELLDRSSRPGALAVDPCAGSGSLLIACHQTGRRAGLVELDPTYADVICRRYQEHTGLVPRRLDGTLVDFTEGAA